MYLFLLFMFRVCLVFLSVNCSLVVTCWERADLLALVIFSCGVLCQICCLIVSILDFFLLSYFIQSI